MDVKIMQAEKESQEKNTLLLKEKLKDKNLMPIKTTIVRNAVATWESVFLIPHLAKIDVIPANKADPNAYKTHINQSPQKIIVLYACFVKNAI